MKLRFVILAGVGLFAASAFIHGALAHSRPIRFDPAPGAILESAPPRITGWFTAELRRDPNWTFLQVTGPDGARVDVGETQLSADRRQLTVELRSGLGPGAYHVTWRVWDDGDGHISGDCFPFYVGQAAADQAIAEARRLDGGGRSECARIDIGTEGGTPVAGGTPQATQTPDSHGGAPEPTMPPAVTPDMETADSGESDGVPVWGLIVGVIAGVVAGGIGGSLISRRG